MTTAQIRKLAYAKKLREYAKILKVDQDWDYSFILILLQYKLARTRQCIVKNQIIMSADKVGKEIAQVELLLDRVLKDKYHEEISKEHVAKYGSVRMRFGKAGKDGTGRIYFNYPKATGKLKEQADKEARTLHIKAGKMRVMDLKKAFDLMVKNMFGWWD